MNCYYRDDGGGRDGSQYVFIIDADKLPPQKRKMLIGGIEKMTGQAMCELAPSTAKIIEEPAEAEMTMAVEELPAAEIPAVAEFSAEQVKGAIASEGDSAFLYFVELYNNGVPSEGEERENVRQVLNAYAVGRLASITEEEIVGIYKKDPVFFNNLFNALVSKKLLVEYTLHEKEHGRKPTQKGCLLWVSEKYRNKNPRQQNTDI